MKKLLNYTEKETLKLTIKKYIKLLKEFMEMNKPSEKVGDISDLL